MNLSHSLFIFFTWYYSTSLFFIVCLLEQMVFMVTFKCQQSISGGTANVMKNCSPLNFSRLMHQIFVTSLRMLVTHNSTCLHFFDSLLMAISEAPPITFLFSNLFTTIHCQYFLSEWRIPNLRLFYYRRLQLSFISKVNQVSLQLFILSVISSFTVQFRWNNNFSFKHKQFDESYWPATAFTKNHFD